MSDLQGGHEECQDSKFHRYMQVSSGPKAFQVIETLVLSQENNIKRYSIAVM